MFERLLHWFHAKPDTARSGVVPRVSPPKEARSVPAVQAPAAMVGAPPSAAPSAKRSAPAAAAPQATELFLEQLARDAPPVEPLTAEEEAQISRLVLQVVEQLGRKKIDPPVMPALVPRVLALVGEPEVDLVRLSRLIEQDMAIGAKLLSVANSPAFGGSREIKSVRDAISYLGTEQVAQVAIGLACRSNYEQAKGERASTLQARWSRLFQHGMTCAFAAAYLASQRIGGDQELAFLGGMFHDVGKAVALRALESIAKAGQLSEASDVVIGEVLHRVHAYPGDEFYEKWTLPDALMVICAQHHQLEDIDDPPTALLYVTLTSGFDDLLVGGPAECHSALSEVSLCADRLAMSELDLRGLYTQTRAFGERAKRMFGT
jgi:putative nucleotidyltransferase with HDIG domain